MTISNQRTLKRSVFKCISWLKGSFFGGEHRGFLKKGVKTEWRQFRLLTRQLFFRLNICTLGIIPLTIDVQKKKVGETRGNIGAR